MVEIIEINKIKPAEYNPRKIDNKQFKKLKQSIVDLGYIIPILVNSKNNTIIAGHQRTKAGVSVGKKTVPAIFIDNLVLGDEIKFNQIHNAVDKTEKTPTILNEEHPIEQFIYVPNAHFIVGDYSATYVKEICKIVVKYGNVLSCVVCNNKVVYGENYIKACQLLSLKVNTYICDNSKEQLLYDYLLSDYGQYYYDQIKRQTYVQGLAQLYRSTEKRNNKRQVASKLYETMVLPYLKSKSKVDILDFGCGKGAYINMLSDKYEAVGLEFYPNNGKAINISAGNKMIDKFIERIKVKPKFDVVVCDSVLNSVDSKEAEKNVLHCLNLFCNKKLFISGRPIESVTNLLRAKRDSGSSQRYIEFLDDNLFTANYRQGQWYFQHYHDKATLRELLKQSGFEIVNMQWTKSSQSFQIECNKVKDLSKEEYRTAVEFEFNLPLPNNKTYNRHNEIIKLLNL